MPIVIVGLSAAIVLQSAGLINAAFAHQATSAPTTSTSFAGPPASAPPAAKINRYAPVPNWTSRPPPPPLCKPDRLSAMGEQPILLELKRREAALNARSEALDRDQQELNATKAALRLQVKALKPLATRLLALNAEHHAQDDAKWAALVATYEAMVPRNAARIFDGLDPDIVFNVVHRMNNRKSAAILADMTPAKAQAITERLAGRPTPSAIQPANALLPDGAP